MRKDSSRVNAQRPPAAPNTRDASFAVKNNISPMPIRLGARSSGSIQGPSGTQNHEATAAYSIDCPLYPAARSIPAKNPSRAIE